MLLVTPCLLPSKWEFILMQNQNTTLLWFSGKLWYLQHNCTGDNIVYYSASNLTFSYAHCGWILYLQQKKWHIYPMPKYLSYAQGLSVEIPSDLYNPWPKFKKRKHNRVCHPDGHSWDYYPGTLSSPSNCCNSFEGLGKCTWNLWVPNTCIEMSCTDLTDTKIGRAPE